MYQWWTRSLARFGGRDEILINFNGDRCQTVVKHKHTHTKVGMPSVTEGAVPLSLSRLTR